MLERREKIGKTLARGEKIGFNTRRKTERMTAAILFAFASAALLGTGVVTSQLGLRTMEPLTGAAVAVPSFTLLFLLLSPIILAGEPVVWRGLPIFAVLGLFFPASLTLLAFASNRALGPVITSTLGNLAPLFSVALAVLGTHGPTIVYIHESTRPIHVNMRAGTVMSTVNTATGRVFSAYLPPKIALAHIARELTDERVIAHEGTRLPKAQFEAMVAEVRTHGIARAVGVPIPGINALSAPVFDHMGALVLVVTTLGPVGSFDPAWDGALARQLCECAEGITHRLGTSAKNVRGDSG